MHGMPHAEPTITRTISTNSKLLRSHGNHHKSTMEDPDKAMTAIAIGSAAVAGAATQVAPPKVKEAIASGRNKCSRWFDQAKKKYKRTYLVLTVANAILNVSLYFLDIFTDVVLLITFLNHGWLWSSVGSITFIAVPYLVAMYGVVRTRKQAFKDYIDWDGIDWDFGYDTRKKLTLFYFAFADLAVGA